MGYLSTSFKTSFLQLVLVSTVAEHPLTNDQISFYSHHHSHEVFIMALLFWALRLDSSLHSCCEYTHCGKTWQEGPNFCNHLTGGWWACLTRVTYPGTSNMSLLNHHCLLRCAAAEWICPWTFVRTRCTWMASLLCGSDGGAGARWAGWTAYHTGHNSRDAPLRQEEKKYWLISSADCTEFWCLTGTVLSVSHCICTIRKAMLGTTWRSTARPRFIPTPPAYGPQQEGPMPKLVFHL